MYFNNDVWCPNTIPIHNLERAFHFTNFFYNQVRPSSYCACIWYNGSANLALSQSYMGIPLRHHTPWIKYINTSCKDTPFLKYIIISSWVTQWLKYIKPGLGHVMGRCRRAPEIRPGQHIARQLLVLGWCRRRVIRAPKTRFQVKAEYRENYFLCNRKLVNSFYFTLIPLIR